MVQAFADLVKRAVEAGFDIIELHQTTFQAAQKSQLSFLIIPNHQNSQFFTISKPRYNKQISTAFTQFWSIL
ncbi:hypothetical protein LU297_02630 [Moraxella nasicaprae]|uniref:Uncharacterized protein n=1 Tax=Moraxella nasicaprae TaxID=2904122 RepID=A0ABY6F5K7_9GAMM|nr:hypothetical protein LU297_02630 [Moraxella nasicaprae]